MRFQEETREDLWEPEVDRLRVEWLYSRAVGSNAHQLRRIPHNLGQGSV